MLFRCAAIAAAALPAALALPAHANSDRRGLQIDNDCIYPEGFDILDFTIWTPTTRSNASSTLNFGYFDESTNLQTTCRYNASSKNVAQPDLSPRYACDNAIVEFIWQDGMLTMIERACPSEATSEPWEAAGTVQPVLNCANTTWYYTSGVGNKCTATVSDLQANFTSLEPAP